MVEPAGFKMREIDILFTQGNWCTRPREQQKRSFLGLPLPAA
jgi:hypothetical protein